MNMPQLRSDNHLLYWVAATVLLAGLGLTDTAVVAWCASLAAPTTLLASLFSFVLVSSGVLFTVWQMRP